MAKVRLAPFVEEIHGTLNGVVFKKSPKGNIIVTKRPDMSNVKWSKAQKAHRKRMAKANEYAAAAMADPKVCAIYEKRAAKEHRVPYRLAVSDYYKGKNLLTKKTKAPPTKKQGRKNNGKS
jgi:hypothetical protein